jgi:3-methyladenine DNA glycosylase/8-oxoguanine DNA glycosylase
MKPGFKRDFFFTAVPPYDFTLTVQKPAGWSLFTPFESFENGVLWTAAYFGERLLGFRMESRGSVDRPRIAVRVYSRGKLKAGEWQRLRDILFSKLSLKEDLRNFYRMARRDPILKHTVRDLYGMHSTGPAHLFADVVLALSLHMAPMKRSEEMMECFIERFGGKAEFDGHSVLAWPTARKAAAIAERELRVQCRMGFRAKYVVGCAKMMSRGFPEYEALAKMTPEAARDLLLELPGIGDYSADILNPHGGLPIDVWTADIFGVLFYGKTPKDRRAAIPRIKKEGQKRWGRFAWLAFFYVVQDLENLSAKLRLPLRLH